MAVDQPTGPAWAVRGRDRTHVPPGEQRRRIHCDTRRGKLGEREQQPAQPVFTGNVRSDGGVRPTGEDPTGQPRERLPRPDLHEDPYTGRVHRLDLIDESDRARNLLRKRPPDRIGAPLIRPCRGV